MRFESNHLLTGISRPEYAELYFDEDFNAALCVAVRLGRELLSLERTGTRITRRVRVEVQDRKVPAPVAKVLGTESFAYVEELSMDLATYEGRWRTTPVVLAEKFDTRGTLRFLDEGANVRRIVDGEIDVSFFGIGAIVERFICADAEKSYAAAAEFTRRYLTERR